ncbi:hypothetical protein AAMO2058_000980200 [Amorphochlora amoebiformis]
MRVSFVSQALIAVVWSTTAVNPERFRKIWRSFDASSVCSNGEAEEQSCTWPDPRYNCDDSKDPRANCQLWAAQGECNKNPAYMLVHCAKSCGSCFLSDKKYRCVRNETNNPPAISKPGELNSMFESIMEDFAEFQPVVHSKDPWLVTFEEFMTEEEVDEFMGFNHNFERSKDAGKLSTYGGFESIESEARTSSSAWCLDACWDQPIMQTLADRIKNITRVPIDNGEYPQVLRYYKNQEYIPHHDYIPGHLELPIGPRLYTFFVYLSDVEEGGETYFPYINNIKVSPKKGKAALWPSVLDEKPMKKDPRTKHAALPVIKGSKYAMNIWLHMFNFHDPFELSCTG